MSSGVAPDGTQMLKVFVGTLGRLFNPDLVRTAVIAAAIEAGVSDIEASLPVLVKTTGVKKGKKEKKEKKDKPRKVGGMVPYTLFTTMALDRIGHDSSYTSLSAVGPDGKPPRKMSIAASLWKQLSVGSKETFIKTYLPLCEQLKVESTASGQKTEHVLARIREFESTFDAKTKASLKDVLPENMPASKMSALAVSPSGTPSGQKRPAEDMSNGGKEEDDEGSSSGESSSSEEDSDEDDESTDSAEEEARKAKEAEEAARLVQARKEEERKEEERKEEERKKKGEKKTQKKAKGAEEGSAKKVREGEEEGSAKKSKKK